jgi:hypothetical protein
MQCLHSQQSLHTVTLPTTFHHGFKPQQQQIDRLAVHGKRTEPSTISKVTGTRLTSRLSMSNILICNSWNCKLKILGTSIHVWSPSNLYWKFCKLAQLNLPLISPMEAKQIIMEDLTREKSVKHQLPDYQVPEFLDPPPPPSPHWQEEASNKIGPNFRGLQAKLLSPSN